jgi:hypothetical protein
VKPHQRPRVQLALDCYHSFCHFFSLLSLLIPDAGHLIY